MYDAAIEMHVEDWRGYSAYELAVQDGYEGTQQQWLQSLRGADGAPGTDGRDGADGLTTAVNGKQQQDGEITLYAGDIAMDENDARTVRQAIADCSTGGTAGTQVRQESVTLAASAWQGTPNMPLVEAAYDDATGCYTLAMPEGWQYQNGCDAAFDVPALPNEAQSAFIAIGTQLWAFDALPQWTQGQRVSVRLTNDGAAYVAAVSPATYALVAPWVQAVTADVTAQQPVVVSPAPACLPAYAACAAYACTQADGMLTFTASACPQEDLTVQLLKMEVTA